MPLPPVPIWATNYAPGQYDTAAAMNTIGVNGTFLTAPTMFLGKQGSAQSIPNTTVTAIAIDTTVTDVYGGHSNVTNNSRYTCQATTAGWYLIIGSVLWSPSNLGSRSVGINKNGTNQGSVAQDCTRLDVNPNLTATVLVPLAVGDYVEVVAYQSTGSASSTVAGSYLAALWIHS